MKLYKMMLRVYSPVSELEIDNFLDFLIKIIRKSVFEYVINRL